MAKSTFQILLDDIPNPQDYSKAGAAIEKAGVFRGEAEKAAASNKILLAETAFTVGAEVAKGVIKSDIQKKVADAASRFEDAPENVKGREAKAVIESYDARIAAEPEGVKTSATGLEDPLVIQLREQANKYRRAESRGLLTRDETLTRMATAVKKWSAIAPGLASEFRKAAWNEVGISNIDTFQIHQALTTQSVREKAQLRAQIAEEKFVQDVAEFHGKPPSLVTQSDAERFFLTRQLAGKEKALESEAKIVGFDTEKKAKKLDELIANRHATNLIKLSSMFNDYEQLNVDPSKIRERDAIRANINAAIGGMRFEMDGFITTQGNAMGLGLPEREKRSKFNTEQMNAIESYLKTQEGFDAMRQIIGRNKDTAEDMSNRFKAQFPALVAWGQIGVAPELFKVSVAPGGMDTLKRVLGAEGAAEFANIGDKIAEWSRGVKRMYDPAVTAKHGALDLRGVEAASYSPEEKRKMILTAEYDAKTIPLLKDVTPEKRAQFGEAVAVLTHAVEPTDINSLARFNNTMDTPHTMQQISQLSAEQRGRIAAPIFARAANPVRETAEQVRELVEQYNNDPSSVGNTISIGLDTSGRLVPVVDIGRPQTFNITETPAGGVVSMQTVGVQEGASAQMLKRSIEERLKSINTNVAALGHAHTIIGDKSTNRQVLNQRVHDAMKSGQTTAPLTPVELKATEERQEQQSKLRPEHREDYISARDRFMEQAEGVHPKVYNDNRGNPTIGIGFNLSRKDADVTLGRVLDLSAQEIKDLRSGKKELKPEEIRTLFAHNINEAEAIVNNEFKDVELAPEQRQVAVSLVFNGGPSLVTGRFSDALKNGDIQEAVHEVLYHSGTQSNAKLAKRRHREAILLAAGDEDIIIPTLNNYLRTVERRAAQRKNGRPAALGIRG